MQAKTGEDTLYWKPVRNSIDPTEFLFPAVWPVMCVVCVVCVCCRCPSSVFRPSSVFSSPSPASLESEPKCQSARVPSPQLPTANCQLPNANGQLLLCTVLSVKVTCTEYQVESILAPAAHCALLGYCLFLRRCDFTPSHSSGDLIVTVCIGVGFCICICICVGIITHCHRHRLAGSLWAGSGRG